MSGNPDVMNAEQAAAFLGVHMETMRKLARQARIPGFKVGREWRFRREFLLRWADEQQPVARLSVLVTDDDPLFSRSLYRLLRSQGHRPLLAQSGPVALEVVAAEKVDLILLDLVMPGMTGPQFLQRLRLMEPDLPVVIVTGYPDGPLMQEAMDYAPLLLLPKPLDPNHLKRTLRTVTGQRMAGTSSTQEK
jgi:excisionase family DNA binding protein